MELDKSFEIGSYLATIFSAVTAYYAIRQTIIQRKISIKPQLIPSRINFTVKRMEKNGFSSNVFGDIDLTTFHPSIINSGTGTALNVHVEWEYPYIKKLNWFKENISKIDASKKFDFEVFRKKTYTSVQVSADTTAVSSVKPTSYMDFIAPLNIEKEPYVTECPYFLFSLALNEANFLMLINGKLEQEIDGPILHLKYSDIEGNKYSTQYRSSLIVREIYPYMYWNGMSGSFSFQAVNNSLLSNLFLKIKKSYNEFIKSVEIS